MARMFYKILLKYHRCQGFYQFEKSPEFFSNSSMVILPSQLVLNSSESFKILGVFKKTPRCIIVPMCLLSFIKFAIKRPLGVRCLKRIC